jgi:hypothetical protein
MLVAATCALGREYDARSVVTRGRRRGTHLTGVASRCFASEAALLDNLCAAVFAALRAASGVRTRARCPLSSSVVSTRAASPYTMVGSGATTTSQLWTLTPRPGQRRCAEAVHIG